ncbi:alpha/beta hydrolase [Streptomyces albus subsp. chlorinus]|uniref:alpha/beta fold hydrolase n=1 Tax=Streptomyces albus TaxID=1888 RepID=UPI0015707BFC|nr:alpha/beta hydrolase [Streptomyces albus]NSC22200.1 alpha/beta hydrolase [Streptomyces albus subsp. chlorinus]
MSRTSARARTKGATGPTGRYALPAPTRELTARSGDGVRFPVEVHGRESDPAVVLAHGWTCSTLFWAPVIRELTASGHRVIVYDQRGHGRSPAAATPMAYSTAMLADDLCAVLDAALEPGERAVIGGHSMGGMTLMAAAGREQLRERGAALMLCSTGAEHLTGEARVLPFRSERVRRITHRALLGSSAPLGPVTSLTRKALAYGTLGPDPDPVVVETTARIVHACPTRVRSAWGGVLAGLDLSAKVPRLDAPTAVVIGTHDRLTPLPHAHRLAALLPACTGVHQLARRGHMTPLEEPETVAEVLARLVRDHLAAAPARTAAGVPADARAHAANTASAASTASTANKANKATTANTTKKESA